MGTVHGIKVDEISYARPGNGLPEWVKERAAERGYGDALEALSLFITKDDVDKAFDLVAHGDGAACVMAQAGRRLGVECVYFYRTTAWVDFGTGPMLRFTVPKAVQRNVIQPFDNGDRDSVETGVYPLMPPSDSASLRRRREYDNYTRYHQGIRSGSSNPQKKPAGHFERVVMAKQADK